MATGGGFAGSRLLTCPAEQASAECLAGASTAVTTSGLSPCSG
jgi:hypothetical protein